MVLTIQCEADRSIPYSKGNFTWDYSFKLQGRITNALKVLLNAGYRPKDITIFMICNWKTKYKENIKKLDLLKVWNIKAADCYFDNQVSPNIKPKYWTAEEIKDFRSKVRKHNQLVRFKLDPEETIEYSGLDKWVNKK